MQNYAVSAIQAAMHGQKTFCKFLSANDTGLTGGHQAGIYVSKPAVPIMFNEPGERGTSKDRWVNITWQDDYQTTTRFLYYGERTRNEYRITNFGRGFPFLRPDYTGALFVLVKDDDEDYRAFVLNTEDDINQFLDAFGISPTETNRLIETEAIVPEVQEKLKIDEFISNLTVDFPTSEEMSAATRQIQNDVHDHNEYIRTDPDSKLLAWTDFEFKLFRALEYARYGELITHGCASVEEFINTANTILNRRKSRAGKSLENHLAAIFDGNNIQYSAQAITEEHKKPDFLFPSKEAYHNPTFSVDKLVSLAAKTTCKDRWRQVITEANRLRGREKYLCTLQQGISAAQMDEMQAEGVVLVVPRRYISSYPRDRQERIWTISKFVSYIRELEDL